MLTLNLTCPPIVDGARVVETPDHPLIARIHVLPESAPGENRPKIPGRYVSPSQIWKYKRCEAEYMFRYVHRLPETPDSARFFGIRVHKAADVYLSGMKVAIFAGEEPNHAALLEAALEAALIEDWSIPRNLFFKQEYPNGPTETEWSLRRNIAHAVQVQARELWSKFRPLAVEQGYYIEWKDNEALPLLGYADLIHLAYPDPEGPDPTARLAEVHDFKNGREKSELAAILDDALSTYAIAHELTTGILTRTVAYDCYVRNKEPRIAEPIVSQRNEGNVFRLFRKVKMLTERIRLGQYMPEDDDQTCKGCDYFDICRAEYATAS